jgi:mannan endo-1,4-beta-mannosidase
MKKIYKVFSFLVVILLTVVALGQVTTARAAVGFHISGRNLIDANGNNFIIRGISHAHVWYPSNTASFADIKNVKANTIRVVLGGGGRYGPNSASDVANVINLCKNNKLICVLEDHDTTGYGEDGAATTLASAVNYWKSIQSVLTGQENYVIINIGNEPYGNNNPGNWVADTKNAIIAMRNAGFQHTLMVDAPNWGQDHTFVMRDNAASVFASDTQHNTIFSVHMYSVYSQAATIKSYIDTFKNNNLPLVIGEFGWQLGGTNVDVSTIMSYAQSNGVGWMAWSWSGNGGADAVLDMVTGFNANQHTSWGNTVMTGSNGLSSTAAQCSVYSGINPPTATRTRTPTPGTGPTNTPTRTPTPGSGTTTTVDDSVSGTGTNQFNYIGSGWNHCTNCNEGGSAIFYNSSQSWLTVTNSSATIAFNGKQIKYYAVKSTDVGIVAVSIDGGAETMVDLYGSPKTGNVLVWTSPTLTSGNHTFKIRDTGTKNGSSSGATITLDRVDIIN